IQQLQQQIGSHASRNSSNNSSLLKSGLSVKEQYLARSRYVAGQTVKNASYRNSVHELNMVHAIYGNGFATNVNRRQSLISVHSTQNGGPLIAANVTGKTDWAA
ncbi:unnamed protein product, partial [Medioppia subpectinata]